MRRRPTRLALWIRWALSVLLVLGLCAPVHLVAVVAHQCEESLVDCTSCPDDDDGCPPNCSACPCGERPCVPAATILSLSDFDRGVAAPRPEGVRAPREYVAGHRLERPPRA
jgi:hypothetical protein